MILTGSDISLRSRQRFPYSKARSKSPWNIKIFVIINKSNIEFVNSGGEVYLREYQGAIIKSFSGKVKIGTRIGKTYILNKGEVCGVLPSNILIESDYYLRRKINVKANEIYEDNKINVYYDFLFLPYTTDFAVNDYLDNLRP